MKERAAILEKIQVSLEALENFIVGLRIDSNKAEVTFYTYFCKQLDQEIKELFRASLECEEIENHYRSLNLERALEDPNKLMENLEIYSKKFAQIRLEVLSLKRNSVNSPEESILDWEEEQAINSKVGLLLWNDKMSKITYSEGKFFLNGKSFYEVYKKRFKDFWDFAERQNKTILDEDELIGFLGEKEWYGIKDAISRQHRSYLLEKVQNAFSKEGLTCPDFSRKCLSFDMSKRRIKLWRS